jgi:hypothetical protein
VSYRDVVRGKPRFGVVSFARPCFYHFRTGSAPAVEAAAAAVPPLLEAPADVSNFKMGLFMLTVAGGGVWL